MYRCSDGLGGVATIMVQSDKPGHPALLHKQSHALTYADHVLVAHDVVHTIACGVAHGIARDTVWYCPQCCTQFYAWYSYGKALPNDVACELRSSTVVH